MGKKVVTKSDIRGTASGVMFMAFFGTVWADIGIGGLQVSSAISLFILAVLIGAILFFSGMRLMKHSRHLPSTTQSHNQRHVDKWFSIIFATQFGLIAIAAILTNIVGKFEWFFPIMAIIVGVHFFPLAHLFQVKMYYVTGTLICLLAIVILLFVPIDIHISGHQIDAWWTFIGLGSMFILWITSVVILFMGRKLVKSAYNMS